MTDRKVWETNLQMQNESFLQQRSFNTFGLVIQYLWPAHSVAMVSSLGIYQENINYP